MRKLDLLALVAVLSFGFVGCAGSFKDPLSLPDPDQATVVGTWISQVPGKNQLEESYVVVLQQRALSDKHAAPFVELRVDKATFDSVREGDKVELELMSYTLTQDNAYLLEIEYRWHVSGRDYPVIFKCDATKCPVPPKIDPKSS